jgi:hypothetical protein
VPPHVQTVHKRVDHPTRRICPSGCAKREPRNTTAKHPAGVSCPNNRHWPPATFAKQNPKKMTDANRMRSGSRPQSSTAEGRQRRSMGRPKGKHSGRAAVSAGTLTRVPTHNPAAS